MSFDSRECWDCPSPIFPVVLWIVAGLALLVITLLLLQHGSSLRLVGYCLSPVVALWYFVVSGLIWKFGIVWITGTWYPPRNPMAWRMSRAADLSLAVGWYAVSLFFIARSRRRRRAV